MNTEKPSLLLLINCFFNVSLIDRCLESIQKSSKTNFTVDIVLLENPSKYSHNIKLLTSKYNIYKHYICNDNIEGNIFTLYMEKYRDTIEKYTYIAMTEGDVVLEENAMEEAIEILERNDSRVGNLSIDIEMNYTKYYNLPIREWIPVARQIEDYDVGPTGFQCIVFKRDFVLDFFGELRKNTLCAPVALGNRVFYGLSDSNLTLYTQKRNTLWVRTKKYKLDHIGWEMYIDMNNEYVKEKEKNLLLNKIRNTGDIRGYTLEEI
jgi:hypothetical protein